MFILNAHELQLDGRLKNSVCKGLLSTLLK